MIQEFGSKATWVSLAPPAFVLYGVFVLPMVGFLSYIIYDVGFTSSTWVVLVLIVVALFLPYKHLKMLSHYPPIEYDGKYIIVTQAYQGRKLYEVNRITYSKSVTRVLFVVHSGLPSIIPLVGLSVVEREQFLAIVLKEE